MDWLEFFAALINTVVSWPVVFLVTVWTLRHQIGDLLRSLSAASFRYGELEGKIKLKEGLESRTDGTADRARDVARAGSTPAYRRSGREPTKGQGRTLHTCREIPPEYRVQSLAYGSIWGTGHSDTNRTKSRSTGAPFTSVVRMLADEGRVPSLLVSLADELARLHNETLSGQVPVTEEAAVRYIDLSLRQVSYLRRVERSV